ncbi:unnamed protein product [marine sediment metagenome]|uniref:Uncharacterized protein n=1 Tax=marine sediment metagenome TaxID=412755 RepID=X1DH42_9ZZZZ
MPPNRRANIRRRFRQTDEALRRAQSYLASIQVTWLPQHPELEVTVLAHISQIEGVRRALLTLYRRTIGGTERSLWKAGDTDTILAEASPVPDPQKGR